MIPDLDIYRSANARVKQHGRLLVNLFLVAIMLGLTQPAIAQVPPGVPTKGPSGDTRPGPVCVWFVQKAGHDVAGYFEKVWKVGARVMVGVKLKDGRRVNCVVEIGIQDFKLIQLTEPFDAGSEVYGVVPVE